MKGILLASDKTMIPKVYSGEIVEELKKLVSIDPVYYTKEELCKEFTSDVDFIFSTWNMPIFTREEIMILFPNLKCVFYSAGTVKYFAKPFLENDVKIFSAAAYNGIPVAEFATSQIILANKGYFHAQKYYKQFSFKKARRYSECHVGNWGAVIGLLGFGKIARNIAKRLLDYDCKVIAYDPFVSQTIAEDYNCKLVDIATLFAESDVVSNHLPDLPETRGIIDKDLISSMKPYSTIINTGRGKQIKELDLCKVLIKRRDICAVLDVSCHEPAYPWSLLYFLPNIFMSPHIAGSISREKERLAVASLSALRSYLNHEKSDMEIILNDLDKMA